MRYKTLIILAICLNSACSAVSTKEFQEDADFIRLEHLAYWTGIIETYHAASGDYPFQDEVKDSGGYVLVRIATRQQMEYLSEGGKNYRKRLDNNQSGAFKERSVKDFVADIETVLGLDIEEKYDIQKVPTSSPIGYYYFASEDGYALWVTCISCGVTQISTLLGDGYTPTVNIASPGMVDMVTKARTREDMLSHPTYKSWMSRGLHKSEYVRGLVEENIRDSKMRSTQAMSGE